MKPNGDGWRSRGRPDRPFDSLPPLPRRVLNVRVAESDPLGADEQTGYADEESGTVQEGDCFGPTANVPGSES